MPPNHLDCGRSSIERGLPVAWQPWCEVGPDLDTREEQLRRTALFGRTPEKALSGFEANGPTFGNEMLEPLAPGELGTQHDERQEQIVQLFRIAHFRTRLIDHTGNRLGIEASELSGLHGKPPTQRHRPGSALLERRIVQEGIGSTVQDLVRQG